MLLSVGDVMHINECYGRRIMCSLPTFFRNFWLGNQGRPPKPSVRTTAPGVSIFGEDSPWTWPPDQQSGVRFLKNAAKEAKKKLERGQDIAAPDMVDLYGEAIEAYDAKRKFAQNAAQNAAPDPLKTKKWEDKASSASLKLVHLLADIKHFVQGALPNAEDKYRRTAIVKSALKVVQDNIRTSDSAPKDSMRQRSTNCERVLYISLGCNYKYLCAGIARAKWGEPGPAINRSTEEGLPRLSIRGQRSFANRRGFLQRRANCEVLSYGLRS